MAVYQFYSALNEPREVERVRRKAVRLLGSSELSYDPIKGKRTGSDPLDISLSFRLRTLAVKCKLELSKLHDAEVGLNKLLADAKGVLQAQHHQRQFNSKAKQEKLGLDQEGTREILDLILPVCSQIFPREADKLPPMRKSKLIKTFRRGYELGVKVFGYESKEALSLKKRLVQALGDQMVVLQSNQPPTDSYSPLPSTSFQPS
jgi:hypothetical protein